MRLRRALGASLILTTLALVSLVAGLGVGALRTGQIDPLHWLWPALATFIVMAGYTHRLAPDRPAVPLATVALMLAAPPIIVSTMAGSRPSILNSAIFALLIVGVCIVASRTGRHVSRLLAAIVTAGLLPAALDWATRNYPSDAPLTAVLSGVPLFGVDVSGAAERSGEAPLEAVLDRAPFWSALAARRPLRPIDAIDEHTLSDVSRLLIVQPRLLQPSELVVLDSWVRAGGQALILADPFLLWPDARPFGHPRRPPVTSLLDPLLSHWGVRLEPANIVPGSPVEHRLLADGALLNLAAASSFTILPGGTAQCVSSERGLIASCQVGRGKAILVADADFIDAGLWTQRPQDPERRADWTSDAIAFVDARLGSAGADSPVIISWVVDDRLVLALACGLVAIGFIAVLPLAAKPVPMLSHFALW